MINIQKSINREQIVKAIRSFFYERDFHEVIPSILNEIIPGEPNLVPFSTVWKTFEGEKKLYLSMSPERGIKKMLAEGIGNCFAISKSFRNLERSGTLHSPEFLMLEWYRKDAIYTDIMADVEKLLNYLRPSAFNKKWSIFSLKKLFEKYLGIELGKVINDKKLLFDAAAKKGYQTKDATWAQIYDQLFVSEIESKLPTGPLFLIDFPARISPLCKPQKDNPVFAERFECYVNGIEIGNGNTENTDVKSVRKVFEKEKSRTNLPIDEEFLNSLNMMNKNSYVGIGIGLDRLVMILNNETSIDSFI